ncbi:MAG: CoA-binding protein [Spirochaetae bacterium HGW-Spirochaetae-6]|nr:MAG: CoA-binding protein [Spirochaetae bacterium HGW-Spirochaetae-6]
MNKVADFFNSASFAVVGATDRTHKWGYKIFKRMEQLGKPVFPIHPKVTAIDGVKAYPTLKDLPQKPEAVDIIVPPEAALKVLEQCKNLGITKVWLQPGAESEEAITYAENNGISLVYDDCVLRHPEY